MNLLNLLKNRLFWIILAVLVVFGFLWHALYQIQVTDKDHYEELAEELRSSVITVNAERGLIYDCNGVLLAGNETSESLYYTPEMANDHLAESLALVLEILDETGGEVYLDTTFPIELTKNGKYVYTEEYSLEYNEIGHYNFLAEVFGTSRDELTEAQKQVTASEAYRRLRDEVFAIPADVLEGLTAQEQMRLIEVRYAIYSGRFDPSTAVRIARDISTEAEVRIMERFDSLTGFTVSTEYYRVYPQGELFAHIVGYVGLISAEEYETYTAQGYDYELTDTVGKTGIEGTYETQLKGTNGELRQSYSESGSLQSSTVTVKAVDGVNIYLTIDATLQQKAYDALYDQIKALLLEKITGVSQQLSEDENQEEEGETTETYSVADVLSSLVENRFVSLPLSGSESSSAAGEMANLLYEYAKQRCDDYLEIIEDLVLFTDATIADYNETEKTLYDRFIVFLRDEEILSYDYQDEEDYYSAYAAGELSANSFFRHCLKQGYFDTSSFEIPKGASDDEILEILVKESAQWLKVTRDFSNMMYDFVLTDGTFSAGDFYDLLLEQGKIKDDSEALERYEAGLLTDLEFLKVLIETDEITPANINLDPCSGSVVISDPNSGEVKAMVSYPSFDPERFMNDETYYNQVVLDQSGPLTFRAVYEARAIGSTYKMLTAVAALDQGIITARTKIQDDYEFPYANSVDKPHCWTRVSHGNITVTEALDHSCNYFFYQLGYLLSEPDKDHEFDDRVGLRKLANYAKLLGLATETGIEIGETTPQTSTIDAVRSSIGQGNNAFTCANINRYTDTLANEGTVYQLFMVGEIQSADGETVLKHEVSVDHETQIDASIYQTVKQGMRLVVTDEHKDEFEGLEKAGIKTAGKTGTVQEIEDRASHSMFTGYAHADDPEIAITIMIPFGGGSANAIPVFIRLISEYYGVKY